MASLWCTQRESNFFAVPWKIVGGGIAAGLLHLSLKKKKICSSEKIIIANIFLADIWIIWSKKHFTDATWTNRLISLTSLPIFCTMYGGVIVGYKVGRKLWKAYCAQQNEMRLKLKEEIKEEMNAMLRHAESVNEQQTFS